MIKRRKKMKKQLGIGIASVLLGIGMVNGVHAEVAEGVTINSFVPDKSLYHAQETATLKLMMSNPENTDKSGSYEISIQNAYSDKNIFVTKNNYTLKANQQNKEVSCAWQTPAEQNEGYLVTVKLFDEKGQLLETKKTAIDNSQDWTKYPRMGGFTNFNKQDQTSSDNVKTDVSTQNNYHMNVSMYYDAYARPQNPIPSEDYRTWIGENINRTLIRNTIQTQHSYNQTALLYNMINATTGTPDEAGTNMSEMDAKTVQKADGTKMIQSKWGVFRTEKQATSGVTYDEAGDQATFNMWGGEESKKDSSNKIQSYYNTWSKDWQQYIGKIMKNTVDELGFDGWQGDTIGNIHGTSYENRGTTDTFDTESGYQYFADNMKADYFKDKYFGINAVAYGGADLLAQSKADFQYAETWYFNQPKYSDLADNVNNTMEKSGKSLIIPAYMYHAWARNNPSTLPKTFNDNAILLKDAVVFANGGDSFELVDNGRQLYTEYYLDPRKNQESGIQMSDELGNSDHGKLKHVYDFVTGYESLLRGNDLRLNNQGLEIWTGSFVGDGENIRSASAEKNKVYAFSKSSTTNQSVETLNFVNLRGVTTDTWQIKNEEDEKSKDGLQDQKDLWVKYYPKNVREVKSIAVSSPDSAYQSEKKLVEFWPHVDENGQYYVTFKLPSLNIWDLVTVSGNH